MPATDSAAHLASIGRSLLSLRRDQPHHESSSSAAVDLDVDAFQRRLADLFLDLSASSAGEESTGAGAFLSLSWTSRLLEAFMICLEDFRTLLFDVGADIVARPPLDRIVADFFDRAVKALDVCNAVRDGLDEVRRWRRHVAIVIAAFRGAPIGEAQVRRARKALTELTVLMMDEEAGPVVGHWNLSFGRNNTGHSHGGSGSGHRRSSSSGSATGASPAGHTHGSGMSRSWSAGRQLQAIGSGLSAPRGHDVAATGGLASAVYAMGVVQFLVAWVLVAAVPCQDRGLQAHFSVLRSSPWAGPLTSIYEKILEESKRKDRRHSCGLLKEIVRIEKLSHHLMEITDTAVFPLDGEKEAEVLEIATELADMNDGLKGGLDLLEKQLLEASHRMLKSRMDNNIHFSNH